VSRVFVGKGVVADTKPDALFKSFVMIVVSEIGKSSLPHFSIFLCRNEPNLAPILA
jgi:hypothetical protein